MPIGVPTSAPSSRPSKASETVAPRCRQISPLASSVRSLSPIRLGRLLQNSLKKWPAENSQISNSADDQASAPEPDRNAASRGIDLPRPGPPGGLISSDAAGSVMVLGLSRQIAEGDDIRIGKLLHRWVGDPQHFKRGLESGLLRAPVMREAALGCIVRNGDHKLRRSASESGHGRRPPRPSDRSE